ncbi:MAG: hypothetical protein ACE5IH_09160 [Thermodesulfobacteriota bacterium]
MKRVAIIISLVSSTFFISSLSFAIETAPRITDREIVERLTKIEEGQKALLREIDRRFEAVDRRFEAVDKRFETMEAQGKQLREDMNAQFNRIDSQFNRLAAIFTALVVAVIGFAIWDRRTMIRPFETRAKEIEGEITDNRTKLHSLLDALRTLSKSDEKVAEVLRRFNLL